MTSRDPSIRTRTLIVAAIILGGIAIIVAIDGGMFLWAHGWGK